MINLKMLLEEEIEKYTMLKKKLSKYKVRPLNGSLVINKVGEKYLFYRSIKDSKTGKVRRIYIKKEEMRLARRLAQDAYMKKVSKKIDKSLKYLIQLNDNYENKEIEYVFNNLHPIRRALVIPIEPTLDMLQEEWINKPFVGNSMINNDEYITKNNESVRSKSEKIIADFLYDYGIAYKYECPIYLKNGSTIYPDFTIFDRRTGGEIYWEHHGIMGNPNYSNSAIKRIEDYEDSGIFLGDRLIVTFESSLHSFNTSRIERIVKKYLL